MRTLSRAATALGLVGIALVIVAGAVLGLRLGSNASEPSVEQLRIDDPALAASAPASARRSTGGFTGFGLGALPGEVIAGGELVSVQTDGAGGTLVFRNAGRQTSVRFLDNSRLFELVAGTELAPGDTVVLRIDGDEVVGLLRISPELDTGE